MVLGVVGAVLAVVVFGTISHRIGPLETSFSVRPATEGRTDVDLAPLGSLRLATHDGPLRLQIEVERLQLMQAQALLDDEAAVDRLPEEIEAQSKDAIRDLAERALLCAFAGGVVLASLRRPHWRSALVGGVAGLAVVGATFSSAVLTWNEDALAEPRYTGLLALAPQAVGDVRNVSEKFSLYRSQLNSIVDNVAQLYETTKATGATTVDPSTIRVLHISDLHLNPAGFDLTKQMVDQFRPSMVIDTGDINDWGTAFESTYVERIGSLGVPYIYIRGNHDSQETQNAVAAQPNAVVLDDTSTVVAGLRIWGIGDPRFTADKELYTDRDKEREVAEAFAFSTKTRLQAVTPAPDVALVHDPTTATEVDGLVPLVLAGHLHQDSVRQIGRTTALIQGSTGGAGLRSVQDSGDSLPLECSMLYFDALTRRLVAYDQVTVQGLGGSGAQIQRHYVKDGTVTTGSTTSTVPSTSSTSVPVA
jgi:predicted MPP superfamily phosphohydrolase